MKQMEYVITDELGIHARPAGLLVKEATRFQSDIRIKKGEKEVDAKRLFAVMGMGIKKAETITVIADGADETEAIKALEVFFRENL